jgi:hypothetical protein
LIIGFETIPKNRSVSQSVRAPTVSSIPLDNIFKVAIVVQQSMIEFSNAEREVRTMATAKLVSYIMKQNGH